MGEMKSMYREGFIGKCFHSSHVQTICRTGGLDLIIFHQHVGVILASALVFVCFDLALQGFQKHDASFQYPWSCAEFWSCRHQESLPQTRFDTCACNHMRDPIIHMILYVYIYIYDVPYLLHIVIFSYFFIVIPCDLI